MRMTIVQYTGRGFTLMEMLVVVLIMGILVGTVGARLQPRDSDLLRIEAQRLARLLELAGQDARLTGTEIAWSSDGHGYRFWRRTVNETWSEVGDDDSLRARALPPPMLLSGLRNESGALQSDLRLRFLPDGARSAFSMNLSLGHEQYVVAASPIGELHTTPAQEGLRVNVATH